MKIVFIILFLTVFFLMIVMGILIFKRPEKGEKGKKYLVKEEKSQQIFDFVIIGCGITGAYLAYSLRKKYPNKSILVVEINDHVGGRLCSLNIPDSDKISLEYGGMRCFEEIHPRLVKLLRDLKISRTQAPYKEHENIYNLRGEIFRYKNLFPNSEKKYFIRENEKNVNIFDQIDEKLKKIMQKYINLKDILDYKSRILISQDNYLSTLTFNSLILNGKDSFSIENWQRYLDIFGYTNLYNREESLLSGCVENCSLTADNQYFIQGGTQAIVKTLVQDFSPSLNSGENHILLLKTKLLRLDITNDLINCHLLKMSNYQEENIISAKKVYLCTPISEYENILYNSNKCSIFTQTTEKFLKNCQSLFHTIKDNLDTYSLSKIFLYYEKNWWSEKVGINRGRNITTDKLNQVWFYHDNYIMIYASLEDADYWNSNFPYSEQKELIETKNEKVQKLNELIQEKLKVMFQEFNLDVPLADKIGWKFWEEAYAQWTNVKPYDSKYKNIDEVKQKLRYPFENINITYVNNDISLNQGWMEGSLEEVDDILSEK
jgi:hypothetical protein